MESMESCRRFLKADAWREWQQESHETDQQKGVPAPPVQKPCPADAELIALAAPEALRIGRAPLIEVIRSRRSRRRYTADPLSQEELSFLLWATQGVREVREIPEGTRTVRTVPSAGSRHAFETYLAVRRVTGLRPGLYRYLPLEHKLCLLGEDAELAGKVATACCRQRFIGEAAVVFIWTAIPHRTEWRYTITSPKLIALDAGHVCQNLYLAAGAIGAGACAIAAYYQDEVDALLGVDGQDEFAVYIAPVGRITGDP